MTTPVVLPIYASIAVAMDTMGPGEIAFCNVDGAKTIIIKNTATTYETFSNAASDLTALLVASGFTTLESLITTVATLRDNALIQ